jgi:hypothetical protein
LVAVTASTGLPKSSLERVLVGGIGEYEDSVRMAYVRGPEGIIVSLSEQLGSHASHRRLTALQKISEVMVGEVGYPASTSRRSTTIGDAGWEEQTDGVTVAPRPAPHRGPTNAHLPIGG